MKPLVCLVSPAHLSSNPRLVKEADALHAAGRAVHVVCGRHYPPADALDRDILDRCPWPVTQVDFRPGMATAGRVRRALSRAVVRTGISLSPALAAHAWHGAHQALAEAAQATRASLYIGHMLAGLAAAGEAADRTGARLGFDAEDFHPEETETVTSSRLDQRIIASIEGRWLPRCTFVTAASPLIGAAYASARSLAEPPLTVLNVFPRAEAPARPAPAPADRPRSLYWFSQTIGPGRGLEAMLRILARARTACQLSLRGTISAGYREELLALAASLGGRTQVQFLPPAPPSQMARLCAGHDLGLCLELRTPRNRDLCLTNKIFTYVLGGLPALCSRTLAQDAVVAQCGEFMLSIDLDEEAESARRIDAWFSDPARCNQAAQAAWQAGQDRFNWEAEQRPWLDRVGRVLDAAAKP
jgi:hypothetical protein